MKGVVAGGGEGRDFKGYKLKQTRKGKAHLISQIILLPLVSSSQGAYRLKFQKFHSLGNLIGEAEKIFKCQHVQVLFFFQPLLVFIFDFICKTERVLMFSRVYEVVPVKLHGQLLKSQ